MELSQNKLKYIVSLHQKKNREAEGVFIAEGIKVITDLIKFGFIPQMIAYNPGEWELKDMGQSHAFCEYFTTTGQQDKKMSLLATPPGVMAVFPKPVFELDKSILKDSYVFLLDNVNDPGNLGTIIRTAHWFGIHHLFITPGSVEVFSPKVVQSSMGSLAAVKVYIIDNEEFISDLQAFSIPVFKADMEGKELRSVTIKKPACIVFGNESNGLSKTWTHAATDALTITATQPDNHPESLNLSVTVGIFMELLTTP